MKKGSASSPVVTESVLRTRHYKEALLLCWFTLLVLARKMWHKAPLLIKYTRIVVQMSWLVILPVLKRPVVLG
jgi:hypothetical protein